MHKIKTTQKASSEIGIAIILMAILLLLGSIFVSNDSQNYSKQNYLNSKSNSNNEYPEETYLFYLNETDIGRQKKVTSSFPNIELGSKIENNIIYIGNNFKIQANPFSKTYYSFDLNINEPLNTKRFLIYFSPKQTGSQDLIIKTNGRTYYQNKANINNIPITINTNLKETDNTIHITFELDKPKWYQLWKWNSLEISDLKVVEISQDITNNEKQYNFQIEKEFLERVETNIVIDCDDQTSNNPVKVSVNDYIIADFNPDCDKYTNTLTREIPLNVLNSNKNNITFETTGYYKLGYSINKIYYNDQETYKFTINSFNDIIDVIMYGDFDVEVLDLRLNEQTIQLSRDEIISIIPYLRFGTNEIKFLTKPVEIEEFVIEKNEFIY